MQEIITISGKKLTKFQAEILSEGKVPLYMITFNENLKSFKFGKIKDGKHFVILTEKSGKETLIVADTAIELLNKNKFVACIPEIIEYVRKDLPQHGANIYKEIGKVDYSKPFFSFVELGVLYSSQNRYLSGQYDCYLFKTNDEYFVLHGHKGTIHKVEGEITIKSLMDAGADKAGASKACFKLGVDLENINHFKSKKEAGKRRFPNAQWFENAWFGYDSRFSLFGIFLAEYAKEGSVAESYDFETDSLIVRTKCYIDTASKEFTISTVGGGSWHRYPTLDDGLMFVPKEVKKEIAAKLDVPYADDYMGITIADIMNGKVSEAKFFDYPKRSVLIKGDHLFSNADFDIFRIPSRKENCEFVVFTHSKVTKMEYYEYDELGDLLEAIQGELTKYGNINLAEFANANPKLFPELEEIPA